MENKGFDLKKIIGGIVILIAVAVGIIQPSDLLSNHGSTKEQEAQTTQVESTVSTTVDTATTVDTEATEEETTAATEESTTSATTAKKQTTEPSVTFRNQKLLDQHYEKHGIEMGFANAQEYEKAAAAVVENPKALHKTEAEDGDDVYYIEDTNEFVIVSKDGYLRTYFNPSRGLDYYNRQ